MSDIYLQITETPTVVTLSAPVISGALSSTVTVANVVTVALDANSLSALENVTVTVGAAITGTVTVSNFPSTQTIAGTVTANAGDFFYVAVQNGIQSHQETNGFIVDSLLQPLPAGTNRIGVVTIGGGTVTIGAGTAQIGSVTASISNSLTISSLPVISGTVTVGAFSGVSVGSGALMAGGLRSASVEPLRLDVATGYLQVKVESAPSISGTVTLGAGTAQIGSVTASISNSVTIGSLPAISGTVTANVPFFNFGEGISDGAGNLPIYGIQIGYADSISGEFQLVADNKPLPISGTVTANSSNGSLTTRFGSVTTANTAFATSAVTNANRKYLLIQNITTASNVITVGIGFTPTTTQGIQLLAGAGLTFEGSYIPTGAVNLLSSVTASCYTILEA